MLAVQVYRPELLPDALRPKPRIQTVEVKTPAPSPVPSAQYVALLQRDGGSPAFILTVDAATKNFTVRKVGADAEPGKSFELWLISDRLPQPRSLGVIGGSDFTARPVLADYDAGTINAATFAVTVEQAGGSPDGKPHSAPVFTGKLIETVPAAAASAAVSLMVRRRDSAVSNDDAHPESQPAAILRDAGFAVLLRMRSVGVDEVDRIAAATRTKKKTPVGSGRFRSQLGGSWGLNYPRGDFGGL